MSETAQFTSADLDAYFRRIGWRGERHADAGTLRGVHLAHAHSLPFENLAQRVTPERHLLLNGAHLTETRADGTVTEREITAEAEARRVLEEEFDIAVPEGTTLLS
jgi:arylamine N-acetyltransferase